MRWKLALILSVAAINANADEIDLKKGDIHLDTWDGVFATKLDGNSSIVVSTDYDQRSMTAVVIDNDTGKTYCLPNSCEKD